jgi:hypothetical protein
MSVRRDAQQLFPPQRVAHWVCPCGDEPPKQVGATPAGTIVSLMEPACPFCGRKKEDEYRRDGAEAAA